MIAAVSASSSSRTTGRRRCVARGCPITPQARRSETSILERTSATQSRRREGLSIFPQALTYQDQLVQRQLRDRLSQPLVLSLQILQALSLIELQPAIVASPANGMDGSPSFLSG